MKLRELKARSKEELERLLAETREQLRAIRFGISTAQHPKVREARSARKLIARISTILKSNERV